MIPLACLITTLTGATAVVNWAFCDADDRRTLLSARLGAGAFLVGFVGLLVCAVEAYR
jgi:hypothetical protein